MLHFLKLTATSLVFFTAIPTFLFTVAVEDLLATQPSIQTFSTQISKNRLFAGQNIQWTKPINVLSKTTVNDELLLETALRIPAFRLAESYQFVKTLLGFLPLAERGVTIHTPTQTIGTQNVREVRAELERRLAIYANAIRKRGFKTISGKYHAKATSSCKRIQSMWADGIRSKILRDLRISQDEFSIKLNHRIEYENEVSALEISGTVVESTLAFEDPVNSDFSFIGEITSRKIIIRPDADSILNAWPTNFGFKPPSREDLSRCTVTLLPR